MTRPSSTGIAHEDEVYGLVYAASGTVNCTCVPLSRAGRVAPTKIVVIWLTSMVHEYCTEYSNVLMSG